jgi:two-component system, sensor histidine kinase and response regulator
MTTINFAESSTTNPVDLETLLDRVGGDDDLLREITTIFLDEYPAMIVEIRDAIQGKDARKLDQAAHTLKGSVANFGAQAATQAALRLETMGRRSELDGAREAFSTLEAEFEQLRPALLSLVS